MAGLEQGFCSCLLEIHTKRLLLKAPIQAGSHNRLGFWNYTSCLAATMQLSCFKHSREAFYTGPPSHEPPHAKPSWLQPGAKDLAALQRSQVAIKTRNRHGAAKAATQRAAHGATVTAAAGCAITTTCREPCSPQT